MAQGNFVPVPPPSEAPRHSRGEELGLPRGIRVEQSSAFRCASCERMQPPGEMAWMPDSVERRDPEWSVTEAARQNAYNGMLSGWCIGCARKMARAYAPGWWLRLRAAIHKATA